jgi:hypothetical protein
MNMMLYNHGVEVCDEYKCEYFQFQVILFMTVSDTQATRNLSLQSKKIGYKCSHYFREIDLNT